MFSRFITSFRQLITRLRTWTAVGMSGFLYAAPFGVSFRNLCGPAFVCHGCPWATTACPVGIIAYGSWMRVFPALALGIIAIIGVTIGRMVCGHFCPFGLLQEFLHTLPGLKLRLPRFFNWGKYLILFLLVFFLPWQLGPNLSPAFVITEADIAEDAQGAVEITPEIRNIGDLSLDGIAIKTEIRSQVNDELLADHRNEFPDLVLHPGSTNVVFYNVPTSRALTLEDLPLKISLIPEQSAPIPIPQHLAYFCTLCPNGKLTDLVPRFFQPEIDAADLAKRNWLPLTILALTLIAMWIFSRPFCRAICPLGAMYALFSRFSLIYLRLDQSNCIDCGRCNKVCPVELNVCKEIGSGDCLACGDCVRSCPRQALSFGFGLTRNNKTSQSTAVTVTSSSTDSSEES